MSSQKTRHQSLNNYGDMNILGEFSTHKVGPSDPVIEIKKRYVCTINRYVHREVKHQRAIARQHVVKWFYL